MKALLEAEFTTNDIPRHVWDAVNNAIHTSPINGNDRPISLCYVAVRAAMKAMSSGGAA